MSGLSAAQQRATGAWIASQQRPDGMIPWFAGGHADPWNHVEAAMALALAGFAAEAAAAYDWLAATQLDDGSWYLYHLADGIEDRRRDTNVCAYVATGCVLHWLVTGDDALVERLWPVVDAALDWVVGLQRTGGEVVWSIDADGTAGRFALLTGTSSIHHSLRAGVALAGLVGERRPRWEAAAAAAGRAVAERPGAFEPKDRWAMDWYYPVLCGALRGDAARRRLLDGWERFVEPGLGVRCVHDHRWVTAAETAECVLALGAAGLAAEAAGVFAWIDHLRDGDGAYWTGCVHPQCVRYPGGERSTYSAAAVLLADHALYGEGVSTGLFAGLLDEPLPTPERVSAAAARRPDATQAGIPAP